MNVFNIDRTYKEMARRNWDTIYVCVDVHDVILEGKYNRLNVGAAYMPGALEVLRRWTEHSYIKLILWSASHEDATASVLDGLTQEGVRFDYINENPECPNNELCDFSKKLYFNILLEDKAGFEGETDWILIKQELQRLGKWDLESSLGSTSSGT